MKNKKLLLSLMWIFVTLNYLYCDYLSLMDPNVINQIITGDLGFVKITENFLLGSALLMEIPMMMVVLSVMLKDKLSRWANIIAGTIMTIVQIGSLFAGTPTSYYLFFSAIEISTTAFIVWTAWNMKRIDSSN